MATRNHRRALLVDSSDRTLLRALVEIVPVVDLQPDVWPSVHDVLRKSTAAEMRLEIAQIGWALQSDHLRSSNHRVIKAELQWLGEALVEIGSGADANKALGLKRRNKSGPRDTLPAALLIRKLQERGIAQDVAVSAVQRFRVKWETDKRYTCYLVPDDEGGRAGAALKKRLQRHLPK